MNFAYGLSWGSSVSSLWSLECSSPVSSREKGDGFCGYRQQKGSLELTADYRGSNGHSRGTNSSSRGRSATSSVVSNRPRGPSEQNSNGNPNSSRVVGDSDGNRRNGGQNSRESQGRYGRGRSSSGHGGYRGRGDRRDREPKMHPGAYKMRDEQTGELVVVWGVEDDDEIPMPTAADLNWRKATVALPGDASEETWAKVIEEHTRSPGSFRVRGVEPGGKDSTDNLYEENAEGDNEEDDFLDDEDDNESESESEELVESPKAAVSRAPRVRVFGRDLWGKSQQNVKVPESSQADLTSEAILQKQETLGGHKSLEHTVQNSSMSDGIDERNTIADNRGHHSAQLFRRADLKNDDTLAVGSNTPHADDEHVEVSVAARSDDKFAERNEASKLDNNSTEKRRTLETDDLWPESSSAAKIDNVSAESRVAKVRDSSMDGRSKNSKDGARNIAPKSDNDVTDGQEKESSGSFNPYILDISEEDGSRSQFKQHRDERKSGLLDRLRSQVLGVKPNPKDDAQTGVRNDTENVSISTAPSRNEDSAGSDTTSEDGVRLPMRDLTARDNYDASIADDFFSLKSFKDVGATPEVIQALSYLHVRKPSQIQAMAFKPILEGKSCIIAEQSGSGKTLAYVAPLVQRLKADEARASGKSLSKKPRVLVLVPTGELAAQVLGNFRALSKGGVPCRSIVITGGFKWKTQVESLDGGADVVVATPGRLLQQLEAGNIHFDNLKSVVLDEVDILFDDEEFSKALETINKAASIKVQYIHVTATLPVDIHDDLVERYPDCLSLMGPSLHRTAIGLQEVLVDCSGGEQDDKTPESAFANKREALLQLVEERPVAKTIIFCNKVETCRKVENVLSRYDRSGKKITVLPYHAALSQEIRLENMETFIKSHPKERLFLVCTDRASRGIDSLDVEHVVLFDFPRDPSEYVRRVGRTARGAGGTGKVFAFVVGRQVGHARRIMARNDKGEPVHDVPGSRYYYRN